MSDPMQEIRDSFFIECEELLESLQDGLQSMYDGDEDPETVNVVFRAVHSIKGGAGAFGLDQLVGFAHAFETALDEVRAGRLAADSENLLLFFRGGDILSDLVKSSREGEIADQAVIGPVLADLDALVEGHGGSEEDVSDFEPLSLDFSFEDDADGPGLPDIETPEIGNAPVDEAPQNETEDSGTARFEITFRPHAGLYESGNDPVPLIRSLAQLGSLDVGCSWESLPTLSEYEGTVSLLTWTIGLVGEMDEAAIREVFEFVEGLCDLSIQTASEPGSNQVVEPAEIQTVSFERPTGIPPDVLPGPSPQDAAPVPKGSAAAPARSKSPPPPQPSTARANGVNPPAPPGAENEAPKSAASVPSATVRVDLQRIDRLVNLVGELVINQAMLSQSVNQAGLPSNSPVHTGLDEFMQLTRNIQESVMMIRAQPIKSLFQRMSRIVREGSAAVDKDVRLVTDGETTEIDKTVIERLADPLTHMVRNALDHGLESNVEREEAGKPREGQIRLSAAHRSGRVVIEVADDGSGIDREKVLSKALERGLVTDEHSLTDSEIDNLLFMAGFSTADQVSNLSGRGVGMDVVKSAITALGGRIAIHSDAGQGTTFSISLPLTLAVLDGMVIQCAGETLVVPLSAIAETLTLTNDDIRALGPETTVVQVRENFVPLYDLATELGYSDPRSSYAGAIVLLIAQEDGSRTALVVDAIEDQRQVVIKGLEDSYGHVQGVAAATILGDGQIALILDPADLIANASGRSRHTPPIKAAG